MADTRRIPSSSVVADPQLVVNLRTAKTLGLTLPQSIIARADELIR